MGSKKLPQPLTRYCRTVARNFMSELDDLFKLDGDLDTLDRTVHQKCADYSTIHLTIANIFKEAGCHHPQQRA